MEDLEDRILTDEEIEQLKRDYMSLEFDYMENPNSTSGLKAIDFIRCLAAQAIDAIENPDKHPDITEDFDDWDIYCGIPEMSRFAGICHLMPYEELEEINVLINTITAVNRRHIK